MANPPETTAAPAAIEPPPTQPGAEEKLPASLSLINWLKESKITEAPQDADPDEDAPEGGEKPAAEKTEKKPEPKPGPAAKTEEKPKADPETPPMRVRTPKLTRPALPIEERVPEPAAPAAETKPDPKWEAELEQSEREIIAEAREVEQLFPDRHKGLAAKAEKFVRDHQKYVDEQGDDFDDQSPEYLKWLDDHQPRLSRQEIEEVQAARVENRVKAKWEPEVEGLKHQLFVRDEEPKVEQEGRRMYAELEKIAVPQEILDAIKKDGFEKARATYKLEIDTTQAVLTAATEDFKELTRLGRINPTTRKPMAQEVTDPNDPRFQQHERLRGLVSMVCNDFRQNAPQAEQFKDGKWFVTREEYAQIPPEKRSGFWTFKNEQIIERAKPAIKATLAEAIKQKIAYLEQHGFKRGTPQPQTPPATPPPKPTPRAPAGGPVAAPSSDAQIPEASMGKQLVSILNRS